MVCILGTRRIDDYNDEFPIDLQLANILFSVDYDLLTGILIEPDFSPMNWLPSVKADNSAPRYLVTS